jgi:tetratricopeptide (TPR) repeat protein
MYRALLLVLPRREGGGPLEIARSAVLLALADVAERLDDAAEATECLESAITAARESDAERAAVERELLQAGLVRRYLVRDEEQNAVQGSEGAFIACSFWLVDAYVLSNQREKAKALFERLLTLQNDVGLLAEEYDVARARLVGNFPQSFSHVALVNSARNLGERAQPAEHRRNT